MQVMRLPASQPASLQTAGKAAPVLGVPPWTGKTLGVGRRAGVAGGGAGPPAPPPVLLYITGGLLGGSDGGKAGWEADRKACSCVLLVPPACPGLASRYLCWGGTSRGGNIRSPGWGPTW